jgi:hypothetical protein
MGKQKFTMANLVYGHFYPELWCENQLKSLCDSTNFPALREKYDLSYVLFTDELTLQKVSRHPNFMTLGQHCDINIIKLNWPADSDQFASRYGLLVQMLQQVIPEALSNGSWLSVIVADLVFAKHSLPKMLKRLETGHDAVFMVPIRSAADSVNPLLQKLPGAPTDLELFEMAYRSLHSLWTHATWDNPYFSKFPYSMVWNSGTGLVTHNFGITPIVFKPNQDMTAITGGIDTDLPGFCKNPYWATDWTDAAVAGVEPLSNGHYPPFLHRRASPEWVAQWAMAGTYPVQAVNLPHPLYYPSKRTFNDESLALKANVMAGNIQDMVEELRTKAEVSEK